MNKIFPNCLSCGSRWVRLDSIMHERDSYYPRLYKLTVRVVCIECGCKCTAEIKRETLNELYKITG